MKISQIRKSLKKIISGTVLWEKEILNYYSVDASSYQIFPKVVVIPKDEQDVISLIKFAKKIRMSVTVRGGGTGLVGSALNNGIILDLRNLNSIKIRKDSADVEAGVFKGMLDVKLKEKGKFFPPNPSVGAYCSIGGMLGNNASGSRTIKYGSVIDNVEEITFVNGNGEKITLPENKRISGKIVALSKNIIFEKFPSVTKNSSGYRLDITKSNYESHKVIIGSEGTLGIILSAKLKIIKIPKKRVLFITEYQSLKEAAKNCKEILSTSPSAVEIVDKPTLKQFPKKFSKKTKCLIFVEYDSDIKIKKENFKKIITGKIKTQLSKESEINQWWRYRDSSLYYSLKSIKMKKRIPHIIEDAAVSVEKLDQLFSLIKKLNQKFGTKSIMYGHAGNANIHVRLISDRKKTKEIKEMAKYYFDNVILMGGTITGEHGDGLARSEFVKVQYGQKNYQIFKELKRFFDPQNVLNPGKIISNKSTIIGNLENFDKV